MSKTLQQKGYKAWMRQVNGTFVSMPPYFSKKKPAGKGWVDLSIALASCCDKPASPTISPITLVIAASGDDFNLLTEGAAASTSGRTLSIYNAANGETDNSDFTYTLTEEGDIVVTVVDDQNSATDTAAFIVTDGYNYVPVVVTFSFTAV